MTNGKGLRVGDAWANDIAGWGELAWSTKWPGGTGEITFSMQTDADFSHPALVNGALVQVLDGGQPIATGTLYEPHVTEGTFTALGLYRAAEHYPCLNAANNSTSIPDDAIDQSIALGLPWRRRESFGSAALTGDGPTNGVNYLHTLLDTYTDLTSQRWYVDPDRYVHSQADPTTPTWHLAPGLTDLGKADDNYASELIGAYIAMGGGIAKARRSDTAARDAFGYHAIPIDLTSLGPITLAKANGILDGLLAKGYSRPSFTETLEVTGDQLTTTGGVPADLSMVQAGQMVRSLGLYDDIRVLDGRNYLDWVIGETRYTDGADTITLSPVGVTPTNVRAVIADLYPRLKFVA